ncbi:M14 family zinc carboxypeptidase [Neptunicella marina]|uniref:Peptidase M14 n=1 Tax=Neptunicella marina TaxID=2125989 RepID=A0A8J6ISE0_9ALTE|nr:M14 family zinc carboxypeptidase [Neptunicella marina]MBC3764847.1 peptidase M14 [Neptunicella marina]
MKLKLVNIILLFVCFHASAQFTDSDWQRARVGGLDKMQIKPADIQSHLQHLKSYPWLTSEVAGQSVEKRNIHLIHAGQGPVKVFMWSQMHGNESTATAALFDFLQLIDQHPQWRSSWQDKISLFIMPMVNPDGANASRRYNAQDIDINRDAARLQTPEGQLLMKTAQQIQPDFGFNLHDQNRYYAVGQSDKPATISVLAPAFNVAKDINLKRRQAMQLISQLVFDVPHNLGGFIGRYNDTFEPRAFGDNFSKMGIRTILIESGGYPDDNNRQVARLANLKMYVYAINSIAQQQYLTTDYTKYDTIPFNRSNGFVDMKVNKVRVESAGQSYVTDIAIKTQPHFKGGHVVEVGDSSTTRAYTDVDATNWLYVGCKRLESAKQPQELTYTKYMAFLKQGICLFDDDKKLTNSSGLPVFFADKANTTIPQRGMPAAFILKNKQGENKAILGNKSISF